MGQAFLPAMRNSEVNDRQTRMSAPRQCESLAPSSVFLAAGFAAALVTVAHAELPLEAEAEPAPESPPFSQFVICWWNGSLL